MNFTLDWLIFGCEMGFSDHIWKLGKTQSGRTRERSMINPDSIEFPNRKLGANVWFFFRLVVVGRSSSWETPRRNDGDRFRARTERPPHRSAHSWLSGRRQSAASDAQNRRFFAGRFIATPPRGLPTLIASLLVCSLSVHNLLLWKKITREKQRELEIATDIRSVKTPIEKKIC